MKPRINTNGHEWTRMGKGIISVNLCAFVANLIFLLLFFAGCSQKMGSWKDFYSSKLWYQQEKAKEKRFTGEVYDKGEVKWIAEGEPKDIGGIIPREKEEEVMYKKGENKTRFLFKTRVTTFDLFIDSFWKEIELEKELGGEKGLGEKKVEIIGKIIKEKITISEKEIERDVLIPGRIRVEK